MRQMILLALALLMLGCSADVNAGEYRVGVAEARAGAVIESARHNAETQIEVKRLETNLEESRALYNYTLATQAQGLLAQQRQDETTRTALVSMAIITTLALVALIVMVIGIVAVAFRSKRERTELLPRPVQLLEHDDDEIIQLFANPSHQLPAKVRKYE